MTSRSHRVSRGDLLALGIALAAAIGVSLVREPMLAQRRKLAETSDTYPLPPPEQTVRLSLGYRSALADILWAHVIVSQGFHTAEKRRFGNLTRLLDAINALDPTFREPYRLADALITFQTSETPHEEIVKAREILERGVANRPLDAELWLNLGQFVALIAPAGYLTDAKEKEQWRADGARMLERAAELSGDDSGIAWQAISGAGILTRSGERDAGIRFLQRTLGVTDDEELRAHIQAQLDKLLGEQQADSQKQHEAAFQRLWKADVPFATRGLVMLLGPPRDAARCAGGWNEHDPACAMDWKDWSEREAAARRRDEPRAP